MLRDKVATEVYTYGIFLVFFLFYVIRINTEYCKVEIVDQPVYSSELTRLSILQYSWSLDRLYDCADSDIITSASTIEHAFLEPYNEG